MQHMLLAPFLGLNSIELIVGDSAGNVVTFFNGEILSRGALSGAVSSLVLDTDMSASSPS